MSNLLEFFDKNTEFLKYQVERDAKWWGISAEELETLSLSQIDFRVNQEIEKAPKIMNEVTLPDGRAANMNSEEYLQSKAFIFLSGVAMYKKRVLIPKPTFDEDAYRAELNERIVDGIYEIGEPPMIAYTGKAGYIDYLVAVRKHIDEV